MTAMRAIDGFPGYQVLDDGRVQSAHRQGTRKLGNWHDLRGRPDAKGYLRVTLCSTTTGKRWSVRIHRLVAQTFIENPRGCPCVRHLDGDNTNNAASNLAWGTYAENEADKHLHGTWEMRRNGKLDHDARALAFSLRHDGHTTNAIAVRLGVTRPTISRLLAGKTWTSCES